MAKLSLCIIVKDEAKELERCLLSVKDYVDEINITLTSDDNATREVAAKYANNIEEFVWCDDFAKARNSNFNLAKGDYILWLDADDVVEKAENLRDLVDTLEKNRGSNYCVMFPYNYEVDDNGLIVSAHWRERIVTKDSFHWVGRIHETFVPDKSFKMIRYKDIKITHLHKKGSEKQKHERNLLILEKQLQDERAQGKEDARTFYYYANTLKGLGREQESIPFYERYIEISGWDEEKYIACVRMADIYFMFSNMQKAKEYCWKAIDINPKGKEACFKLGQIYYRTGELDKSEYWLTVCIKLPFPESYTVVNPRNYDYNPLILLGEITLRKARYKEAKAIFEKLVQMNPKYDLLQYNLRIAEKGLNVQEASQSLYKAIDFCLQNEELEKAETLARNAPIEVRDMPNIQKMQLRTKHIMDRIRGYEKGIRENDPGMNINAVPVIETEKKFNALLVNLVARPEIAKVLDVGCFNGWLTNELGKRGWFATGIDVGEDALEIAKHNAEKNQTHAKFEKMTFDKIGSKFNREFDAVVCFDVLEHTTKPQELIKNLEQACKKDGWIFINIPNGAWHQGFMDTQNEYLWEHAHSYEYRDAVRMFNGRKNLNIIPLKSENDSAFYSPGQGSLFIMYQNDTREGRDIVIFCGNTPEAWDPESVKTGIGGSEEAVINMAQELVKQGHKVRVYNNCKREDVYKGVPYLHYDSFSLLDDYDVFIAWRNPQFFSLPINAKKKYLWLHDVPQPEFYDNKTVEKIDKIFVLSKWHRDCLPNIPDNKFFITTNGILPEQFTYQIDKEPQRIIYASSPDRGLDVLLEMWPEIKQEVPLAELHVFYGWEVYDKLRTSEDQQNWKRKVQKMMEQDGVYSHGRVGHKELAQEYLKAGIWAAPTYFTEISCISAMKAQAAGALPVCTNLAALDETVQYGKKINGSILDGDNKKYFKEAIIKALKEPRDEKYLVEMMQFAQTKYAWANVAKDWINLFNS